MSDDVKKIEDLYHQALDKPKGERAAFLAEACGGDEALHRELQSMLEALEKAGGFMELPALEHAARLAGQAGSQLLAGHQLGPFRIGQLLGRGGMGEVYRAVDTRLDRPVALKLLPAEVAGNPDRLRRFTREAKAASSLNHPNIATIHEIGEAEGWHYIAMEYVEGETLEPRIRKQSLKLAEILDIGIQAAEALEAAHKKGIIHRDIKPANLMLTTEGRVKVLDFGLAKRLPLENPTEAISASTESHTVSGLIMGTVEYMSPEQVLGHEVDQRTDLFSLGVVLYDMVTGRLPFHGDSPTETMDRILHGDPEAMARFNHTFPTELERIVRKCLEKDQEMRYQHASDLCADLKRLKRDADSHKTGASREEVPTARPKAKWLVLGISSVLTLIALVAVLGLWLLRQGREITETPLVPVPLTSYLGWEVFPSLSPDGMQVAFHWGREGENNHIYVKQIGVEPPIPLTNVAANDVSPAWSPDGQSIAFIRELKPKKWALMLIPQRGGSERQLEAWDVSKMGDEIFGPYLAWTPGSDWLAYPYLEPNTNTPRLFLISVVTGEKRRLTTPSRDKTFDTSPAFSPDGSKLVFSRDAGFHTDLYLLRLGKDYKPQGEPQKVDTGFPNNNYGLAWMPNGQEIVFSARNGIIRGLWRMDISKPGKPVSLGLPSDNSRAPSISRTGKRLAYVVMKADVNIWRVDLEGPCLKPGRPVPFISSTKFEGVPAYSNDGKRIAFVSDRSGAQEIWTCGSDGTNSVQMTSFGGAYVYGPKWSPDGQKIAFYAGPNGNIDIYVVSADRGVPQRMTTQSGSDSWPFWSHDGQWLYFKSAPMKNDVANIWKMPSQGGEAIPVTHLKEGADVPQESPDGKFLYYSRGFPFTQSIWRIAVEGGEETKVLDSVHPLAYWTLRQEGIYYFTPPDGKGISTLNLYEFAGGKNKKILETDRELASAGGLAVSPDGRTILYSQINELGADLMMVENFR